MVDADRCSSLGGTFLNTALGLDLNYRASDKEAA